jgi:hypothetical protein
LQVGAPSFFPVLLGKKAGLFHWPARIPASLDREKHRPRQQPAEETGLAPGAATRVRDWAYAVSMYATDILNRVQSLRGEVASLQILNQTYAEIVDPKPFAVHANGERRRRLKEILQELSALAKEKHP